MGKLTIGKYTYGDPIRRGSMNEITIGNFCSIAEGVVFDSGFQHNSKNISTFPFSTKFEGCEHLPSHIVNKGNILIGSDVWIGEGACIMGGVCIGDGAVIGMRSIISKDVAPYTIVAGAPQKVIRNRFVDVDIKLLMQMRWWDWTDEHIKEAAPLLMSDNIGNLYEYFIKNVAK